MEDTGNACYDTFLQAKKIQQVFFEELEKKGLEHLVLPSRGLVETIYDRTHEGLFLIEYYGVPTELWTPWGRWDFAYICAAQLSPWAWATVEEDFRNRVEVSLHAPAEETVRGHVGPVYAVKSIDGTQLPPPRLRYAENRDDRSEQQRALKQWREFHRRYLGPPKYGVPSFY